MATVTGYTAEKMDEISDSTVVDGSVVDGDLILERRDGGTINAGSVVGPQGPPGTDPSIQVVTSGTRPTGGDLFEGLHIYETDTNLEWVWNGAAWGPPPVIVDPDSANQLVQTASGLLVDRNLGSLAVLGHSGKMSGLALPAADGGLFKIQFGNSVRTTDANGAITVVFPTPFTSTLGVVLLTQGELLVGGPSGRTVQFSLIPTYSTRFQFMARVDYDIDNPVVLGSIRFNWLAIGA